MKRKIALITLVLLTGGCMPTFTAVREPTVEQQMRQALAHPDPEMRLSALEAIHPSSREDRIRVQAAIAYIALGLDAGRFRLEAGRLYELVRNAPLHETSRPVQALAYLGARLNDRGNGGDVSTRSVKTAVNTLCFSWDEHLEHGTLEARVQRNLVLACRAYLEGEPDPVVATFLARAVSAAMGNYRLSSELHDTLGLKNDDGEVDVGRVVSSYLTHGLRERGIDLTILIY